MTKPNRHPIEYHTPTLSSTNNTPAYAHTRRSQSRIVLNLSHTPSSSRCGVGYSQYWIIDQLEICWEGKGPKGEISKQTINHNKQRHYKTIKPSLGSLVCLKSSSLSSTLVNRWPVGLDYPYSMEIGSNSDNHLCSANINEIEIEILLQ